MLSNKFETNFNEFNGEMNSKLNALNNRLDNSDEKFETKFNEISSDINKRFDTNEIKFGELNKRFDESDKKWEKLIDSTKQMSNGYNIESVGVTENGNYDGKLCANDNRNKEVTVNKVSNNVSYDDVNKSDILLNENNSDILSLSLIHI